MNERKIAIPENLAVNEAADIREELYGFMAEGSYSFIFDFSGCRYIDSTGLGVLVSVYKRCMEHNGSVKMVHLDEKVMKVFKLTRLDSVFDIS